MDSVRFLIAGDQGLVVEFGRSIDPEVNARVHSLSKMISGWRCPGVLELVPTYRSLMVYFDPLVISRGRLIDQIKEICGCCDQVGGDARAMLVTVPVCYGGEMGPDLEFVADHNGLSPAEVVEIHTSASYLVYMLGFLPGFPYLGGMSGRIAAPRLETPRTVIAAGSVGIAGSQTGIYPMESPGGWRIIGRTPLRPFDAGRDRPFLFSPGDYIRFMAVSHKEYLDIARDVARGIDGGWMGGDLP
ncbi:MAG: 5-oxoprolinase subunit PxpB [Bacillota bacterium]